MSTTYRERNTARTMATFAQMRLDRLADCDGPRPYQAGDEDVVCADCGFTVYAIGGGWRHSEAEARAMQQLVKDADAPMN